MKPGLLAGVLLVAGAMTIPVTGFAAGSRTGIYVAPKLVYGLAHMRSVSFAGNENSGSGWTAYESSLGSRYDSTFGGAVAVGYDLYEKSKTPLRAELEYAVFSKAKTEKRFYCPADCYEDAGQSHQVQTLFLNAYYDFRSGSAFTPYIGAGLGAGFVRTKGTYGSNEYGPYAGTATDSKTVTNLVWNLGVGFGYRVSERVTIDAGYRFVSLGRVNTKWKEWELVEGGWEMKTKNLYQHQIGVGMRFGF